VIRSLTATASRIPYQSNLRKNRSAIGLPELSGRSSARIPELMEGGGNGETEVILAGGGEGQLRSKDNDPLSIEAQTLGRLSPRWPNDQRLLASTDKRGVQASWESSLQR